MGHPLHPIAAAYPLPPSGVMQQMVKSIKKIGLQHKITLLDDQILDGRVRQAACEMANIEPEYQQYEGERDAASLVAYVQAMNDHRRHLAPSQLAVVAGKLAKLSLDGRGPIGPRAASEAIGVPLRTTKRAARVVDHAIPEIIEDIETGTHTVADAETMIDLRLNDQATIREEAINKGTTYRQARISRGASFDTAQIDAAPPNAKPHTKNGAPTITSRQRQDCLDLIGKLTRALSKIGIYDEFFMVLSQIKDRVEQV